MAPRPAALWLPGLLLGIGGLLLLPFVRGSSRVGLACGGFFLTLGLYALLLLLAWRRPKQALTRPLRSAGCSLLLVVLLAGLALWGIVALF